MSTRCTAKTAKGTRCKNVAVEGSKRCAVHAAAPKKSVRTRRTGPTRAQAREAAEIAERAAKKTAFIAELSKRGIVLHACEAAGVGRTAVYEWYSDDAAFAADCQQPGAPQCGHARIARPSMPSFGRIACFGFSSIMWFVPYLA